MAEIIQFPTQVRFLFKIPVKVMWSRAGLSAVYFLDGTEVSVVVRTSLLKQEGPVPARRLGKPELVQRR